DCWRGAGFSRANEKGGRMTPQEQQLIELIAREVIAQLKQRQQSSSVAASGARPASREQVDVRPVLGACTGDYSKFPELADRLNPPRASAQSKSNAEPASQAP